MTAGPTSARFLALAANSLISEACFDNRLTLCVRDSVRWMFFEDAGANLGIVARETFRRPRSRWLCKSYAGQDDKRG